MRIGFENSIVIKPTGDMSNLWILGGTIFLFSSLLFFFGGVQSKLTPPMLTVSVNSVAFESPLCPLESLSLADAYSSFAVSSSISSAVSSSFTSSSFSSSFGESSTGGGGIITGGFGKISILRSNSAGSRLSFSLTFSLVYPTGTFESSLTSSHERRPLSGSTLSHLRTLSSPPSPTTNSNSNLSPSASLASGS